MLGTPIKLTFYGPTDEVIATYSRTTVTSRILDRAFDIMTSANEQGNSKEVLEAIDQLIVDFFGGQFTLDQLKDGADLAEKFAVFQSIFTKATEALGAFQLNGNPTKPGTKPRQRKKTG